MARLRQGPNGERSEPDLAVAGLATFPAQVCAGSYFIGFSTPKCTGLYTPGPKGSPPTAIATPSRRNPTRKHGPVGPSVGGASPFTEASPGSTRRDSRLKTATRRSNSASVPLASIRRFWAASTRCCSRRRFQSGKTLGEVPPHSSGFSRSPKLAGLYPITVRSIRFPRKITYSADKS